MIVSRPLFIMSNVAKFHVNFNISIIVFCMFLSSTLIIANPDILSINSTSTFINLCSFGFNTTCCFGKIGMNLFRKLKQQSHDL